MAVLILNNFFYVFHKPEIMLQCNLHLASLSHRFNTIQYKMKSEFDIAYVHENLITLKDLLVLKFIKILISNLLPV
jgi:hypothetical protein